MSDHAPRPWTRKIRIRFACHVAILVTWAAGTLLLTAATPWPLTAQAGAWLIFGLVPPSLVLDWMTSE